MGGWMVEWNQIKSNFWIDYFSFCFFFWFKFEYLLVFVYARACVCVHTISYQFTKGTENINLNVSKILSSDTFYVMRVFGLAQQYAALLSFLQSQNVNKTDLLIHMYNIDT